MKICYVNYYDPFSFHGGAERVVLKEAELIAENGNEVVIITTHNCKNVRAARLGNGKIKVWFLPAMKFANSSLLGKSMSLLFYFHNPFLAKHVHRILRAEKPDIVHIHNLDAMSISVVNISKRLGFRLVQTFHGYHFECPKGSLYRRSGAVCSNPFPICKIYSRILQYTIKKNDFVIAICSFVRERLIKARYNSSKIVLIPNGFETCNQTSLLTTKSKEILFVGRMVKAKGVHLLIKALAKVKASFSKGINVAMIGDGEDKAFFETQARSFGVDANFLGSVSDSILQDHYESAFLVVLPSLFPELFPIVALEAMSHAKPIIASNIGGLPELVLQRKTGLLFKPNDVDELADCIKYVLSHEELATEMGYRALEVVQKFRYANHIVQLLNLYDRLLSPNKCARLSLCLHDSLVGAADKISAPFS